MTVAASVAEVGNAPAVAQLTASEKQIVDIFELDPEQFLEQSKVLLERTTEAPSASSTARAEASSPGSFERDFWEEVSHVEEQLTASGVRGAVSQTAIALAATNFSLQKSGETGAEPRGRGKALADSSAAGASAREANEKAALPSVSTKDGAAALVAAQTALQSRAQTALLVAQSLTGSALKAAGGGKG